MNTIEDLSMQQNELRTPFGKINMYKNGQRINFEVEQFNYGMYLNDNTLKRPQGLYKLILIWRN